jgi:hypothetical protein
MSDGGGRDARWWWHLIWGAILIAALGGTVGWLAWRAIAMWGVLKHVGG